MSGCEMMQMEGGKQLFAQASAVSIHTGNIVNWSRLKKKCPTSPSEELQDCIRETLEKWCSQVSPELLKEPPATLECTITQDVDSISPEEREELKVSAKLFLSDPDSSGIKDAVKKACSALSVSQLDSVIIAPPPLEDGASLSLSHLQPYWEELETLVQSQSIVAIGTSDLDKVLLEQLYQWAQVKPSSNQVNLASCCVMPPELTAYAKEYDIQLLTHSDPKELIPMLSFQEAVIASVQDNLAYEWITKWVLRYSVIVKSRGIIKSKGYLVYAKRIRY
ncbi:glutamate--cysteine ligase regulatory subunit isoform X1 [Scyliorhinus torazame]|uniref:glutamate--cysteine ligase regulatory subunit isoform X1 n=1 Tax=Scyliorhinus canicula TaxID=7830 RepID=UPI0018F74C61|nr:glutamate--cysteine ligase regulatory subunit isoform X1 [Scyliorhinus canicula]